jgi:hypothetical protein
MNWSLIEDFAERSLHELTVKGKTVTRAFYGRGPIYSYWNGCSTGGRQGLMEVHGKAPDTLLAKNGDTTRPLCRWPDVPRYKGHGSTDQADSFRCSHKY